MGLATARAFAGGIAAAFASTLASKRLVRDDRALWPYAAYRTGLALVVLSRSASPPASSWASRAARRITSRG